MTKILDYMINHNKAFSGWTHYEKWEYREEVLEGMKDKAIWLGAYVLLSAVFGAMLVIGLGLSV